jgi:hypothetical protein
MFSEVFEIPGLFRVKEEGTLDLNAKIEVMDGHSVFKVEKAKLDHAGKYSCKEGASKQMFEAQCKKLIVPKNSNISFIRINIIKKSGSVLSIVSQILP